MKGAIFSVSDLAIVNLANSHFFRITLQQILHALFAVLRHFGKIVFRKFRPFPQKSRIFMLNAPLSQRGDHLSVTAAAAAAGQAVVL